MESSYLDDLYGDFGQGSSDSPVACDESSLDIYSGLDHENSPRCSSNAEKCANPFSPPRTKDSFDLYEEVLAEERKERETSHSELLAKLEKTQTHVKELLCKLQEMQNQNIGLNNENMLLKKNISALIKTARMEIVRKDEEISRLQQRSGRGGFNQYCPRSSPNFQRYVKTRQGNTDGPSGGGGSSTDASRGTRNTCIQSAGANNTSQLPEKAATGTVQEDSSAHVPIRQNIISSHDVLGSDKPVPCSSDNYVNDSRDMEHLRREAAGKVHKQATKSCMETTAKQLTVTEKWTTEAQENRERKLRYQEERNHNVRIGISGKKEERSREREMAGREFKESEKDREKQSRRRSAHTEREQQRRSGKGKSPPRSKNQSLQLESSRHLSSEFNSSKNSQKDTELVSRSSRRDPKHCQDQERSEKRAPESSIKEAKHNSSSFRSRHGDKAVTSSSRREEKSPTRDRHRKEERRREEEKKRSNGDKSKIERRKDEGKRKEEEKKGDSKRDEKRRHEETKLNSSVCRKDSEPKKKFANQDTSAESVNGVQIQGSTVQELAVNDGQSGQENSTEENGRTRKLCFMETLNLTLSPVKKPKMSTGEGELEKRLSGEGELAGDCGEVRQSDFFGDGYVVLDEAETSSESSEHDREVSEVLNTHSQKTHSNCVAENDLESLPAANDADSEKIPFPLNMLEQDVVSLKETIQVDAAVVDAPVQALAADCDSIKAELLTKEPEVCATTAKTTTCDDTVQALDAVVGAEAHNDTDVHPVAIVSEAQKLIGNDKTFDKSNTQSPIVTLEAEACKMTTDNEDRIVLDITVGNVAHDITVDTHTDITTDTEVHDINVQTKHKSCTAEAEAQAVAIGDVANTVINTASQDVTMDTESNNSSTDLVSSTDTIETEPLSSDNTVMHENNLERTQNSDYDEDFTAEGEYENPDMDTSSRCNRTKNSLIKESSKAGSGLLLAQQEESSISSTLQESSGDPAFADTTSCHLQPDSSECDTLDVGPSHSEPLPKGPAEVLLHDEDSMLLALKTIRRIPEIISPLTSPARPLKRSPRHGCPGKPPYVRSLDKELSGILKSFTPETKIMEVNKENQEPECSSLEETKENGSSSSSSSVKDELEEGEIVSDSEEEEKQVVIPCTHQIKKSPRLEKPSSPKARTPAKQVKPAASQGNTAKKSKTNSTAIKNSQSPSNKSPSNKRRFQTVMTSLSSSDPSSIHEVMDMLKFIRKQIRKKYMKLHKSFPAKTFYNVIEMSLLEFTEFVKNLNCSKLSSSEQNLKSKLCKIITAMLKQISNNGIVNRIFEQKAPNLKSKLWIFVEQQFDFLFRELQAALINLCECADLGQPSDEKGKKDKDHMKKETMEDKKTPIKSPKTLVNKAKRKALETEPKSDSKKQKKLFKSPNFKSPSTGLGSKGKNLNNYKEDKAKNDIESSNKVFKQNPGLCTVNTQNTVELPKKDVAPTINPATCTPRKPLNVPDKSDFSFEILTEQQASSLTFNLVTDSQMGEIFKCLLQGSDLLEQSTSGVESHSWLVGTPRKAVPGEEKLFMLPTPSKALTPMKVSAATPWSVISPEKFPAFGGRIGLPLNPAVLDESCMLEVPCANSVDTEATCSSLPQWSISHSMLTEDLAVSLTIPSPLKSDSHLSFLQPQHGEVTAVPDSVLSAHYSEDAFCDGEDATEQDIHLVLDSDNSSSSSDSSITWPSQAIPPGFQFKPHLPMQAVVMERSNDHFIVKIRHTSTSAPSETEQKSLSSESKLLEPLEDKEMQPCTTNAAATVAICNGTPGKMVINALCDNTDLHLGKESSSKVLNSINSPASNQYTRTLSGTEEDDSSDQGASQNCSLPIGRSQDHSESEQCDAEYSGSNKRKRCHSEPAAKKPKRDTTPVCKGKRKKKGKSEEGSSHSKKGGKTPSIKKCRKSFPAQSPNSLSAKNVVKKKGAVLVAWTRDDDRAILVDIKKQGASEKTFCSLASRLNKSPSQVYERFGQLMKLFKKTEKMNS